MENDKVYLAPNPATPCISVRINGDLCTGCNSCADQCRVDVMVHSTKKGDPPIVLYPDECWFCGTCVEECPVPGAIWMELPLNQRVSWKRKETGELFRVGMKDPPTAYTKPPVG
jgi:NAD-dependent dihydropyrimidine dehydrogenase PreA subunit